MNKDLFSKIFKCFFDQNNELILDDAHWRCLVWTDSDPFVHTLDQEIIIAASEVLDEN